MNNNHLSQVLVSGLLFILTACQVAEEPLRESGITSDTQNSSSLEASTPPQIFCEGRMAWSAEIITDDVVDYTSFWIAFGTATVQDAFEYVQVEVTLDGNSVAEEMKYRQAAEPYLVTCPESGQQFEASRVQYTLILPPLSSGEHSILWKYTISADLDDGLFTYPRGMTAEYKIKLNPSANSGTDGEGKPSFDRGRNSFFG